MAENNAFSRNLNTINSKHFPNIHARKENAKSISERDRALRSLDKYERMYLYLVINTSYAFFYHFVDPDLGFEKRVR